VAALVALLIVMTILGNMLEGTLRARRQLRAERDRRQTELLVDAGADRAAARLSADVNYRGETWSLPSQAIAGSGDGQVAIEVIRGEDEAQRQVRVVAEYPIGSASSIRRSRTFAVRFPTPQGQE
jgi:hypothetical protein